MPRKKNLHSGPMPEANPDLPSPVPDNTYRKRYYLSGERVYYVPKDGKHSISRLRVHDVATDMSSAR